MGPLPALTPIVRITGRYKVSEGKDNPIAPRSSTTATSGGDDERWGLRCGSMMGSARSCQELGDSPRGVGRGIARPTRDTQQLMTGTTGGKAWICQEMLSVQILAPRRERRYMSTDLTQSLAGVRCLRLGVPRRMSRDSIEGCLRLESSTSCRSVDVYACVQTIGGGADRSRNRAGRG